jgi:hypothetical protein
VNLPDDLQSLTFLGVRDAVMLTSKG